MPRKPLTDGYVLGATTDDALKAMIDARVQEQIAAAIAAVRDDNVRPGTRAMKVLRKLAYG